MPWVNRERCVKCKKRLSPYQVSYSMGRCPLCGHKDRGTGTIVATKEEGEWIEPIKFKDWLPIIVTVTVAAGVVMYLIFG